MGEPFTTAYTRIEGRPTGAYRGPGVEPPAYPRRQLIHSAAPKGGRCGGKKS
jgi:hypothetical protein